jgi:hypothetical protein
MNDMSTYKKHLFIIFAIWAPVAFSQDRPPVEIGNYQGYRIAVSNADGNQRVGNGALVRVLMSHTELKVSISHRILLACDGSWISSPIQSTIQFDNPMTFLEQEIFSVKQDESVPLDGVDILKTSESKLIYSNILSRRAQLICKNAGKEPRNVLIPVAESSAIDGVGSSVSLILGSSAKVSTAIDIWARTTWYKFVETKNSDGIPVEGGADSRKTKVATGKYSLERRAFECRERSMATYQSVKYEIGKSTPESSSWPRDKLQLDAVVPGSVGEAQLDAVCALFGDRALLK